MPNLLAVTGFSFNVHFDNINLVSKFFILILLKEEKAFYKADTSQYKNQQELA